MLREQYTKEYLCALKIQDYIKKEFGKKLFNITNKSLEGFFEKMKNPSIFQHFFAEILCKKMETSYR